MQEENTSIEEPVQGEEVTEQPNTEETGEQVEETLPEADEEQSVPVQAVETAVVDDSAQLEALQGINDTMTWNLAFQVIIVCVLLFQLFLTGVKAGK
jgi:hypothetical protein